MGAGGIGVTPFASILQSLLLGHGPGSPLRKLRFVWLAREQWELGAIQFGDFNVGRTLHSPVYANLRLLVSRPGALDRAFHMTPEYLLDVRGVTDEVDFRNRSLELSRRSRALKLWLTFHTYGLARIRAAWERGAGHERR